MVFLIGMILQTMLQAEEPNMADLIIKMLGAMKVIGESLAKLIASFFASFGFSIPYEVIQILMIALIILTIMKIGSLVSKVILIVVVFILIASFFIPSSFVSF